VYVLLTPVYALPSVGSNTETMRTATLGLLFAVAGRLKNTPVGKLLPMLLLEAKPNAFTVYVGEVRKGVQGPLVPEVEYSTFQYLDGAVLVCMSYSNEMSARPVQSTANIMPAVPLLVPCAG